jgi:glycosyltransferase involved in cell wall biosynthesis/SAM-dependent methyltransferase
MGSTSKPRVLVFIVAYNAEHTISAVLKRIPASLADSYDVDVLIIDDASRDSTFERGHITSKSGDLPFDVHVLFNPINQGYGGNQKLGYHYAIERGYDCVALLHGDGQYAPECLPQLLEPFRLGHTGAVFGSRMLTRMGALRGGMPLYKFVGNKVLTSIENAVLGTKLSEFHSGYRLYSVEALKAVPFDRNSNGFHFDTEIIIQMVAAERAILELPIPTYYGDEICHVNGLKYAADVVKAVLKFRLQQMSLFYDVRFDCAPPKSDPRYIAKLTFPSTHTLAVQSVKPNTAVLDLGCAGTYIGRTLKEQKRCYVAGVDAVPPEEPVIDAFYAYDLNNGLPDIAFEKYDYTLLLDVIEHLHAPDEFLSSLRRAVARNPHAEVLISTGNVAFIVVRLMLLLGQFNYGKRGILDLTHRRLYTFGSMRRSLEQAGFDVLETTGVPAPFPLALGNTATSRFLLTVNRWLIRLSRGTFAYQMFLRIKPRPSLEVLLKSAYEQSAVRAGKMEPVAAGDRDVTRSNG